MLLFVSLYIIIFFKCSILTFYQFILICIYNIYILNIILHHFDFNLKHGWVKVLRGEMWRNKLFDTLLLVI